MANLTPNMSLSKEQVRARIEAAFRDVALGDGIGLYQARAIDDYQTESEQQRQRERDRKTHWHEFEPDELRKFASSLSFFDAEGMRFHLPAYLLQEMEQEDGDVLSYLVELSDYQREQLTALSLEQCRAIRVFLQYCSKKGTYEYYWGNIERALENYWTDRCRSNDA